ncbi:MAG: thioredoxin [Ruminococcaceae bacterium]|nr:thioredoxin [Oscillospiraceae bacterium]
MAILHIDKNKFEELKASEKTIVLDFYAEWCGPCKMIAPFIEEIALENPDITVAKVDVDKATDLAIEFGIQSIPTIVVFKDGKISSKAIGYRSKEQLLELIKA